MSRTALTDTLLSAVPAQCPQLTHCHVGVIDPSQRGSRKWNQSALWTQRLQPLRAQLDATVWCETLEDVEQQRLDKRWRRQVSVRVRQY